MLVFYFKPVIIHYLSTHASFSVIIFASSLESNSRRGPVKIPLRVQKYKISRRCSCYRVCVCHFVYHTDICTCRQSVVQYTVRYSQR